MYRRTKIIACLAELTALNTQLLNVLLLEVLFKFSSSFNQFFLTYFHSPNDIYDLCIKYTLHKHSLLNNYIIRKR